MKKSLIIVVLLVIAGALVFVFGFSSTTDSPAPTENNQPSTNTDTTQQPDNEVTSSDQVTIVYTDDGFENSTYAIASGGTVTVQNNSTTTLEFSSDDHPAHRDNPELNTDAIEPGETVQFTPQEEGEWGFHNHLLSVHTGVLTVGL